MFHLRVLYLKARSSEHNVWNLQNNSIHAWSSTVFFYLRQNNLNKDNKVNRIPSKESLCCVNFLFFINWLIIKKKRRILDLHVPKKKKDAEKCFERNFWKNGFFLLAITFSSLRTIWSRSDVFLLQVQTQIKKYHTKLRERHNNANYIIRKIIAD